MEVDRMRFTWTILALATSACLTLTPAYAASHGGAVVAAQHAHVPQATAQPTPTSKPATRTTGTTTGSSPSTKNSTGTPTPTSSTPLNPIAQKISSHPQLASKVHALLPAGTTLNQASTGFKNQGQFLAALHVSRNLGIPFSKLRTDMTGDKHLSLGQSIQDLKPGAPATTEAHRAETEADDDIKTTTTTTTSSMNKTTKKPTNPTSTTTTTLNPIAQKISSHPALAAKVQALLPAGMTLDQASKGFKNQGQFLAALHVSKDLHIPFAQLKAEMTGKDHDSLGMAIQELRPGTNVNAAVSTAEKETDADLKVTTPQPGPRRGDTDGDAQ
jgi:uncharacterized membrane protein YdfJ with MMPL/SSD domain